MKGVLWVTAGWRCPLPLALVRGRRALLLLGYKARPCRIPTPCLKYPPIILLEYAIPCQEPD